MSLKTAKEALRGLPKSDFSTHPPSFSTPAVSTGSLVVDYLIGGVKTKEGESECPGFPRGRITEVYGEGNTGKTTLALASAAQCLHRGDSVCYIDYGNQFPVEYAQDIGVSLSDDAFFLHSPATWEEGATIIEAILGEGVDLIVVDTLSMARPEDPSETSLSQLMSDFLAKIYSPLRTFNTALVFNNTLRRLPNSDRLSYSGLSLKYYASLRLQLKELATDPLSTGSVERMPRLKVVEVTCIKNMVSAHQGHYAPFVIRYGEGIDNVRSILDIAEARGLLGADSGYYLEGAEGYFTDKEVLRAFLKEHPQHLKVLVERINTRTETK